MPRCVGGNAALALQAGSQQARFRRALYTTCPLASVRGSSYFLESNRNLFRKKQRMIGCIFRTASFGMLRKSKLSVYLSIFLCILAYLFLDLRFLHPLFLCCLPPFLLSLFSHRHLRSKVRPSRFMATFGLSRAKEHVRLISIGDRHFK